MKWLRKLLGLCEHRWVVIHKVIIYSTDYFGRPRELPSGTKYVMQCEHCGNVKAKEI